MRSVKELLMGIVVLEVRGSFNCRNNQLTSLDGCPSVVGWDFDCSGNQLTSLVGSPTEVGENFWCSFNQLTSLVGCPSEVRGNFFCGNNSIKFTEEEVRSVCQVGGKVYV